ncbi:MAG: ribosome maturation factor RimP [Peptococcaceae bacterium]|nr:ribosome maturation factor RimP [Peptococcaceae bacterium]
MNSVEKYISDKYRPMIEQLGYSLYYVEYAKNHKDVYLRLFIEPLDAEQTMDIDACETVSRACSDAFDQDEQFPIAAAYILEVSSPGIERTLYIPEHFQRYVGEKVFVGLYKSLNKKKEFIAVLAQADHDGVDLDVDGETIRLEYKDIAKAQLHCDF